MKTFIDYLIEVSEANGYDARWMKSGEEADMHIFKCYQSAADQYASQFKIHLSPDRVLTQEEFNKQYQHYQELLNLEDVAGFWKENFDMANEERNNLKVVSPEPAEEEIRDGERNWHNNTMVKDQLITWKAAINWYKTKIGRS